MTYASIDISSTWPITFSSRSWHRTLRATPALPRDRLLMDAFACLRHHTDLDSAGRLLAPNNQRHLKSPEEIASQFAVQPQALRNVRRLEERLEFSLENLGYRFPDYPGPDGRPLSLGDQVRVLREKVAEGANQR